MRNISILELDLRCSLLFIVLYRSKTGWHRLRLIDAPARRVRELGYSCLFAKALVDFIVAGARPSVVGRYALAVLGVKAVEIRC